MNPKIYHSSPRVKLNRTVKSMSLSDQNCVFWGSMWASSIYAVLS